jgi:hypothetical protein
MQRLAVLLFAGIIIGFTGMIRTGTSGEQGKPLSPNQEAVVTFKDSISPVLNKNCTPCHFKGGKVYKKLPFDRYETVRALGKKLNTRLKGENADLVSRWALDGYPREKNSSMVIDSTSHR